MLAAAAVPTIETMRTRTGLSRTVEPARSLPQVSLVNVLDGIFLKETSFFHFIGDTVSIVTMVCFFCFLFLSFNYHFFLFCITPQSLLSRD